MQSASTHGHANPSKRMYGPVLTQRNCSWRDRRRRRQRQMWRHTALLQRSSCEDLAMVLSWPVLLLLMLLYGQFSLTPFVRAAKWICRICCDEHNNRKRALNSLWNHLRLVVGFLLPLFVYAAKKALSSKWEVVCGKRKELLEKNRCVKRFTWELAFLHFSIVLR